jgi:hypothetical protein
MLEEVSRLGSLKTVASELAKCKLGSVGVQEIRCDKGAIEPAASYKFPMKMELLII